MTLSWISIAGVAGVAGVAGIVLLALLAGALLLALYATQVAPYRPVLRRIVVPVPQDWPRLAILHLSDLHVKTSDGRLYRAQARFLRSLAITPDLVCVTGDVCEQLGDVPLVTALLSLVQPRLGALLVLGNHEHGAPNPNDLPEARHATHATHTGRDRLTRLVSRILGDHLFSSGSAEAHAIGDALGAAGLRVLVNEGVRLDVDGRSLWVAGVDSIWAGCGRAAAALRGRDDGEPCLGLVHEPEGAPALLARGAALALAGHTHGGQVRFPLAGAPYTHQNDPRIRVAAGLQRLGRGALHISAGLGHTTPLRFNCPPEATWIECVPTAPSSPAAPATTLAEQATALAASLPAGGDATLTVR